MKTITIAVLTLFIGLTACQSKQAVTSEQTNRPDYTKPLTPGQHALEQISVDKWPDIGCA